MKNTDLRDCRESQRKFTSIGVFYPKLSMCTVYSWYCDQYNRRSGNGDLHLNMTKLVLTNIETLYRTNFGSYLVNVDTTFTKGLFKKETNIHNQIIAGCTDILLLENTLEIFTETTQSYDSL